MRGTPKGWEILRWNPPAALRPSPLSQGGLLLRIIRLPCERELARAQHPQGVRRIRKAAKLPTAAQPVTDEGNAPSTAK